MKKVLKTAWVIVSTVYTLLGIYGVIILARGRKLKGCFRIITYLLD